VTKRASDTFFPDLNQTSSSYPSCRRNLALDEVKVDLTSIHGPESTRTTSVATPKEGGYWHHDLVHQVPVFGELGQLDDVRPLAKMLMTHPFSDADTSRLSDMSGCLRSLFSATLLVR
jgi:hypothetical protein